MDFITPLAPFSDIILFAARVLIAAIMLYFGIPKLKNLKKTADDFVGMGFKPGWFWGTIVALVEVFGGILILIGWLVPIAATLFAVQMAVGAIWKIVATDKKLPDWSYDLLIMVLLLVLLAFGTGAGV